MRPLFVFSAMLLASLIAVTDAKASHIFFQNIRINGTAINDPGQQNVFSSPSGGTFTFQADFWSTNGDADNYNVTFNPGSGSTLALTNFSFVYNGNGTEFSPVTLTFTQTPGLGTFNGTFTVDSPQSFPDFKPRGGGEMDAPTFNLTVTQTEAVPEPSTWALLGAGLTGLGALRRRRS